MHYTKKGLVLTKAEIAALLAFAAEEGDYAGVKFRVASPRVYAYATNSNAAVQAEGAVRSAGPSGEWFVLAEFLKAGSKLMSASTTLRLQFSGASLRDAVIEEDGECKGTLTWPEDAAVAQHTFPDVSQRMETPPAAGSACHWLELGRDYLHAIELLSKAAGSLRVRFWPPKKRKAYELATFYAESADAETTWTAKVKPSAVAIEGEAPGVDEGAALGATEEFRRVLKESGATVRVTTGGQQP